MPKAMLGPGDVMVNKKITIPKKFQLEIGIEKQTVTEWGGKRIRTKSTEPKGWSTFTNPEMLDRSLQEKKYVTES